MKSPGTSLAEEELVIGKLENNYRDVYGYNVPLTFQLGTR